MRVGLSVRLVSHCRLLGLSRAFAACFTGCIAAPLTATVEISAVPADAQTSVSIFWSLCFSNIVNEENDERQHGAKMTKYTCSWPLLSLAATGEKTVKWEELIYKGQRYNLIIMRV